MIFENYKNYYNRIIITDSRPMNKANTKKEFTLIQKFKFTLFITLFAIVLITLLGEVILRMKSTDKAYSNKTNLDNELGWVPKEHFSMEYNVRDIGEDGQEYPVKYHTEDNGFRAWGAVNSSLPKVLFIGDSYVQSVEVSNDKTFYNILKDSLNIEVFAFGQAGYGTLQQKLVIDKYFDQIKPDLIVWQSCDNDFLDNNPILEYLSLYKVGLRRPYYTALGKLTYRHPKPIWMEVVDKSKFLELLRKKIMNLEKNDNYSMVMINEKGSDYEEYADVLRSTDFILRDMKKAVGNTPIIGFSASPFEPQLSDMKALCEKNNIPFDVSVAHGMDKVKFGPIKYFTSDEYHWNEAGQSKVASLLIPFIKNHLNTER